MISFKANYTTSVNIGKVQSQNMINPHRVAITELDTHNKKDNLTMILSQHSLLKKTGFTWAICQDFMNLWSYYSSQYPKSTMFFAMSEEQQSYDYLRPINILALAEITLEDDDSLYLDYLQVMKKLFFNKTCYVGKTFLNFFKDKFPDKDIVLRSVPSAIKFYRDNGFVETNDIKLNELTTMRYYH